MNRVKAFVRIVMAEIKMEHRHEMRSMFSIISLLVWPVLGFLEIYYSYHPFMTASRIGPFANGKKLLSFLATGFMAFTCFWSMVQNAWTMSWQERRYGTLEVRYLTPANRMAMSIGRTLGALIQQTWMIICFCIFVLMYTGSFDWHRYFLLVPALLIMLASAVCWGCMINTFALFSRDADLLMDFMELPMALFSGTRLPISAFPPWGKVISMIFPLTYSLGLVRQVLNIEGQTGVWLHDLIMLILFMTVMLAATALFNRAAEKISRETGELQFF